MRDELLTLRNFLKQGMDFSVVEEMVIVDHSFFLFLRNFKENIGIFHQNGYIFSVMTQMGVFLD